MEEGIRQREFWGGGVGGGAEVGDGEVGDSEPEDGVAELELEEEFRWRKGIISPSARGQ
jgi:hypothetical protein